MATAWWDGNGDAAFTISDIWFVMKAVACMPGNFLVGFFGQTEVGKFFEFTSNDTYTWFAWALSVVVWLIVLRFVGSLIDPTRKERERQEAVRNTYRQ